MYQKPRQILQLAAISQCVSRSVSRQIGEAYRLLASTRIAEHRSRVALDGIKVRPVTRLYQSFDQGLQLVKLVFPGDQSRLAGMDDDQVVDAQGGDQAAVIGDDDRAGRVASDRHRPGSRCRRSRVSRRLASARQSPTSFQTIRDLEHPHVRGVFHDGLVDRHALERREKPRQRLGLVRRAERQRRSAREPIARFGLCFFSSSRIVRARQTKIPAFQAKLPAARNCSAVALSGFSRN